MPRPTKYTVEVLAPVIAASVSYAGVLRQLGLRQTGGSQAYIRKLVRDYGLDTSHFLGQRANCGPDKRGGPRQRAAAEILCIQDPLDRPEQAFRLRRALLEIGRPYKCEECGLRPNWNGKPLVLQIDHKNGKRWDHRSENVRFLCPNCHSQTSTFGSLNKLVRVMEQVDVPA